MNRVGDRYRDQTCATGHQDRIDDLARFAKLGITRLRYPALWERIAPDRPDERDWRWTDERVAEIGRLGMRPILGLLHHGSGPRYTSLVADDFVPLFADHAAAVAQRYPHVTDWTPVNEPLTTARFSALYGVWYPHAQDERLFWQALLNQIDGTRAAMRAIRAVNPAARLVQTEDLGRVYSTPALAGHADHLNERRWATWDLLAGRLVPGHPLWNYIADRFGLGDRLRAIADDPCPPDILGVNVYPTSERFLDDRTLPLPSAGYHDLTAVRVLDPAPPGLDGLLRETWDRYRLPIAITESHLGCTREEQLRWLWQGWRTCEMLAAEGVDVRAFTAWALLGNVDWTSLLTREAGDYETGAFDVRGGEPRPTAVAELLRALGHGEAGEHPALAGQGWWQRDMRLVHDRYPLGGPTRVRAIKPPPRPLLITGATGTLGQALARECAARDLLFVLTDRTTLPIDDPARVAAFLDEHRPWAVLNAAGWVRVDDAEVERDACLRANGDAAGALASACAARGIHCTIFSSDLVFDGTKASPYVEADTPAPLGVYGESKALAEALSVGRHSNTLLVRTAAFFSPDDEHNFAVAVERALGEGRTFAASDAIVTPTYVPDLARACLDLVVDRERGIWHLTSGVAVSWVEFGRRIARALGLDETLVHSATPDELGWRARRPQQAALDSTRGRLLPALEDAIGRFAYDRRASAAKAAAARFRVEEAAVAA